MTSKRLMNIYGRKGKGNQQLITVVPADKAVETVNELSRQGYKAVIMMYSNDK